MAHLEGLEKGKWRVVVELGRGPKGKRRRVTRHIEGTKQEAEELMHRLADEVNRGDFVDREDITVVDWLDRWLERKKRGVAEATYKSYKYTIDAHLAEGFGGMPLQAVRPHHIQTYYDRKLDELSGRTVQLHHTILNAAFRWAERLEVIRRNPVAAIDTPRRNKPPKHTFLKPDEVQTIIQKSKEHAYADGYNFMTPLIKVAVHAGLRKGELLGLKWDCVSLKNQTVQVKRTLLPSGELVERTKHNSGRIISISETVITILQKNKKKQAKHRLLLPGSEYEDRNLVFARKNGQPLSYNYVYRLFTKFASGVGIDAAFHDLRHTHASLLHQAGVSLKDIQDRLGHSDYSTTANIYAKADTTSREVAQKLEEIL